MVIQRIQSVYLLIVTILMAIYSFMDVVLIQTSAEVMQKLSLFDASAVSFILSLLVAVLSCITIFKFKQLNVQILLSCVCILLSITQLTILAIEILSQYFVSTEFFICNIMPVISIILLILSIAAIKRDKKILSSYDRLR